jgi:single-strand DNA-binding protein
MNTLVVIEGTIKGTPEIKYTQAGKPLANFEVSVPNGYGKTAKDPFVFKVTAWESVADQVGSLTPDTRVTVYARLTQRKYEWQGQSKTATEIVANTVDARGSVPAKTTQTPAPVDDSDIPF